MGSAPRENRKNVRCKYLQEIQDEYPPFLKDEEIEFRRKMISEGRYKELRDEMVLRNAGLIASYGAGWARVYSAEDAVSIGITGLYEAAAVFDWTREDVKFCTFAGWYIKKRLNQDLDKYQSQVDEASMRYDAPVSGGDSDEACCLGDLLAPLADPEYLAVKDDPDALMPLDVKKWAMDMMELGRRNGGGGDEAAFERYKLIVADKLDNPERTLEERGKSAGVTRERVRQIDAKAYRFIRAGVKAMAVRRVTDRSPKLEDYQTHGIVDWDRYRRAQGSFASEIDREADRYLTETLGVRFEGGCPVKRKVTDTSARYGRIASSIASSRKNLYGGRR